MIFDPMTQIELTRELLSAARRRAHVLNPYSPAWEAAMAGVEDLERQLWNLRPTVLTAVHHDATVGR
jgi:hypothetical protein